MTEYTTSSQALREYMTARERTAYWINANDEQGFLSPSAPPSELDGWIPSSPVSEAGSSDSLPPKMVLRYGDGRPDVPIPNPLDSPRASRSIEHPVRYDPMPGLSTNPRIRTPYPGATSPTIRAPLPPLQMPSQPEQYAHGQPPSPWHSYPQARVPPHLHRQPPAIIYAPSNSSRPNYAPPVIYHHPPPLGPNGMAYSHSAPVGSQYPRNTFPPMATTSNIARPLTSPREGEQHGGTWKGHSNSWGRSHGPPITPPPPLTRSASSDSLNSDDSGSTYYVLPSAGQKIHVLAPSPQLSIATATSPTQVAYSPQSPASKKPPFFKRLLSFAGKFSSSSGEGRRIERRHSTSGVHPKPNFSQH
ncbi:hypothetical protein H0H93_001935 [Arthromyces matolae]|nr:hypothetical protein H0H93_001935 [Arthromyces matolae]